MSLRSSKVSYQIIWLGCFLLCIFCKNIFANAELAKTASEKDFRAAELIKKWNGAAYRQSIDLFSESAELWTKIGEKENAAAALRAAQIQMLKTPRWNEPYFWSAFVLQGEWR